MCQSELLWLEGWGNKSFKLTVTLGNANIPRRGRQSNLEDPQFVLHWLPTKSGFKLIEIKHWFVEGRRRPSLRPPSYANSESSFSSHSFLHIPLTFIFASKTFFSSVCGHSFAACHSSAGNSLWLSHYPVSFHKLSPASQPPQEPRKRDPLSKWPRKECRKRVFDEFGSRVQCLAIHAAPWEGWWPGLGTCLTWGQRMPP